MNQSQTRRGQRRTPTPKTCIQCGRRYPAAHNRSQLCGPTCKQLRRQARVQAFYDGHTIKLTTERPRMNQLEAAFRGIREVSYLTKKEEVNQ